MISTELSVRYQRSEQAFVLAMREKLDRHFCRLEQPSASD